MKFVLLYRKLGLWRLGKPRCKALRRRLQAPVELAAAQRQKEHFLPYQIPVLGVESGRFDLDGIFMMPQRASSWPGTVGWNSKPVYSLNSATAFWEVKVFCNFKRECHL